MNVIVDTSVWSLALRRSRRVSPAVVEELETLIRDHRARIIGPVRQELLSGIRDANQFERLRQRLAAFPDLPILTEDYVEAARCFNACRSKGIQGSNTHLLIRAVAMRSGCSVFTTDRDFERFARSLPLALHVPGQ